MTNKYKTKTELIDKKLKDAFTVGWYIGVGTVLAIMFIAKYLHG